MLKKKFNLFLLLLVFFPCMLLMSACGSQPVKFDIKFMVDGETYATVETGGNETISMPEDPIKDGYEFDGWYWDKDVWSEPFTANSLLNAPLSSNMKVYCKWNVIEYTAYFYADNNLVGSSTFTVEDTTIKNIPSIPEKTGYVGKWEDYEISASDLTINAVYTAVFNVYYNENGGSLINDDKYTYGIGIDQLPTADSIRKTGYIFVGWENSDRKIINSISTNTYGDIYLTAKWEAIEYTACFYADNNLVGSSTFTVEDTTVKNLPSVPEKTGYVGKWEDYTLKAENLIIKAEYSIKKLNITWKNYDGKIICTSIVEYGKDAKYSSISPEKPSTAQYSFIFSGWDKSLNNITEDIEVTAQFISVINKYTITWQNYDRSILKIDNDIEYGSMPNYDYSLPTRASDDEYSYIFKGWSPELSLVTGNIIYIAQYDKIKFNDSSDKSIIISRSQNKPANVDEFKTISSIDTEHIFKSANSYNYTNGVIRIDNSGYILNSSPINGIKSINIVFSGKLSIQYGWCYGDSIHYEIFDGESLNSGEDYLFKNNDNPSFIKIIANTSTYIESIQIVFKNLIAYNRYELDNLECKESDQYVAYSYIEDEAFVTSKLVKTPTTLMDFRIRHWYNGRPVKYFETAEYIVASNGRSKSIVNRVSFAKYTKNLYIPNTITKINDYAFYGMSGVICLEYEQNSISNEFEQYWNTISYQGKWVQQNGLYYQVGNTKIPVYYYSITSRTSAQTFYCCESLEKYDDSGLNYILVNNNEILITGTKNVKHVVVPSEIEGRQKIIINREAFTGSSIEEFTFSSSVITVGENIFQNCNYLRIVNFENVQLKEIPEYTFYGCPNLSSITLNDYITHVGNYAFKDCVSLENFDFTNIRYIGEYAFYNSGIKQFIANDSLIYFGKYCFASCSKLELVNLTNSKIEKIYDYTFINCAALNSIILNGTLNNIGIGVFENCSSLISVDLSKLAITDISNNMFSGCRSLLNVELNKNIISIGSNAFYNCINLKTFDFGHLKSINQSSFSGCKSLNCVDLSESSISEIPKWAFAYCTALNKVILSNTIDTIGSYAFYNCENLNNVKLLDTTKLIEDYAFYNCNNLTSLILGKNSVINNNSFENCPCLVDVIYYHGNIDDFNSLSNNFSFKFINYYLENKPTDEDVKMLPSNCLYWHYDVDGETPVLW